MTTGRINQVTSFTRTLLDFAEAKPNNASHTEHLERRGVNNCIRILILEFLSNLEGHKSHSLVFLYNS